MNKAYVSPSTYRVLVSMLVLLLFVLVGTSVVVAGRQTIHFEQALAFVNDTHPNVVAAMRQLEQAQGNVVIRSAAFAPRVNVSATPVQQLNTNWSGEVSLGLQSSLQLRSGLAISSGISGKVVHSKGKIQNTSHGYSLSFSQRLFVDAATRSDVSALAEAELNVAVATHQLWVARQRAKREVYDLFFRHEAARLRREWAKQAEINARVALDEVEKKLAIGAVGEIAYLTAQISLQRAELATTKTKRSFEQIQAQLQQILGLDLAVNYDYQPMDTVLWQAIELTRTEYIAEALQAAPSLWRAERRIESAFRSLESEQRSYAPTVNITAGYKPGNWTPEWGVRVEINQSLTDFMVRDPKMTERQIVLDEAQEDYIRTKEQIESAVDAIFATLSDLETEMDIALLNYRRAMLEMLQGEQLSSSGMLNDLNLTQLKLKLAEAELGLREQQHNYQLQVMDLHILSGMLNFVFQ